MKIPALPALLATLILISPVSAKKDGAPNPAVSDASSDSIPSAPGAHKALKCPKKPAFTYDIYLPKGYTPTAVPDKTSKKAQTEDTRADACPALFISSPHKNPGFRGLEKWADENKVVLITINDSENGDYANIQPIQEAVFDAVKAYNLHPCLRFATGHSGAAAASANIMYFHPKEFAGVILQCHSAYVSCPTHIAYGYIGGLKDTTQPDSLIREGVAKAKKSGRYVQQEHLPMGHDWAPAPVVSAMLSNMLFYARLTHPGLSETEKKNSEKLPDTLLARAATETDPAKACEILDPLVSVDAFKRKAFHPAALDAWCSARVKIISALSGVEAFKALMDDDTRSRFAEGKGKAKPAVDALRKQIEGDSGLKDELAAWKDFEKASDAYDRENARGTINPKALKDWKSKFEKLAKKYPGTHAGEKAAELAK